MKAIYKLEYLEIPVHVKSQFGAGVTYDVAVDIQLIMDVRYSLGLSNIAGPGDPNGQSFQPDSWKSKDVKVLVGVLFALR